MPRPLVVVSHACVVAANRAVYEALATAGDDVALVVPRRWRTEYAPRPRPPDPDRGTRSHLEELRVVGTGRPQRHVYVARLRALLDALGARAVLIEEEPFSLAAAQWRRAARAAGVPFFVQLAETLERRLPAPVARSRDAVLRDAALVLARSPLAAALAERWGARGEVAVVPHDVVPARAREAPPGPFTVAFVGRLVEEKGLGDLLEALRPLEGVRLVVAGAGPLAVELEGAGPWVEWLGPLTHEGVAAVYARADVTCVPSRTTPRWEEQFGRVAVESLCHGVPVVATTSGALPWVLERTGGGVLVPEGDAVALRGAIEGLRDDPRRAADLGTRGRQGAIAAFSTAAVADTLGRLVERLSPR